MHELMHPDSRHAYRFSMHIDCGFCDLYDITGSNDAKTLVSNLVFSFSLRINSLDFMMVGRHLSTRLGVKVFPIGHKFIAHAHINYHGSPFGYCNQETAGT